MDSTTQSLCIPPAFWDSLYRCFGHRVDVPLTAGTVLSPIYLNLAPAHRGSWKRLTVPGSNT